MLQINGYDEARKNKQSPRKAKRERRILINIILYGMKEDYDACVSGIGSLAELQYRKINYTHADNYDLLIEILLQTRSDVIVVLANGAEGMEGVMASKKLCPDTAVVWFSDDEGFGPQSYRLGCTYFAPKPVTEHTLSNAFKKYRQDRIAL